MGHEFTVEDQLELAGSPEEVWDAIARGPGMDAWFLGRNEVTPGLGGAVHSDFGGGAMPASSISTWEPPHRLVTTSATAPDGRFLAQEYLVAARGKGASTLRIVTSGFLPGDDWEAEFEAMRAGGCVFRSALAEYIAHFTGRKAHPLTVFGPAVDDWTATWALVDDALGLTSHERGAQVRLAVPGRPVIDGVLYSSNDQSRSIRTSDALYRILQGFVGGLVLCHVIFTDPAGPSAPEPDLAATAWLAWLESLRTAATSTSQQIGSSS